MLSYASDPLFWQRFLSAGGFYAGSLDGHFGPASVAAADAFASASRDVLSRHAPRDARTEANLLTLHVPVQQRARLFLEAVDKQIAGTFKVLSGTRTYAEQNALYAQGRGAPGPVVTRARGGYSNHNFGVAFDVGVFQGNAYLDESPLYRAAGQIGKAHGLEWGGDWRSIQDEPHFQAVAESELTSTRRAFEAGKSYL